MTTVIGILIEPLDVLFFRDGRPFGQGVLGKSALPIPQTLSGAFWTAILESSGCDFRRFGESLNGSRDMRCALAESRGPEWLADIAIRGPWLARAPSVANNGDNSLEVLVPTPSVLQTPKKSSEMTKGKLYRLRPVSADRIPGWRHTTATRHTGLRPLWLNSREATEPAAGFLKPPGLRQFLADQEVDSEQLLKPTDLYAMDHRTGIGIDPARLSAEEGMIYGASFLALQPEISFYAEVALPSGVDSSVLDGINTIAFGGEGRRARLRILKGDRIFQWPSVLPTTPRQRPLLMLTTPGLFDDNWRPRKLSGNIAAAAVPDFVACSGWDLVRRGPKPTRFAAQAGSVYYLSQSLGNVPSSLADRTLDQSQGWGCFLTGVWTDDE